MAAAPTDRCCARWTITVDVRERELIAALKEKEKEKDTDKAPFSLATSALDVGDVSISRLRSDETSGPVLVVERKTWADLSASICDGRWGEQKRRLQAVVDGCAGCACAYVIEGRERAWGDKRDGANANAPARSRARAIPIPAYAFSDDGDEGEDGAPQTPLPPIEPPSRTRDLEPRVLGAMLSLLLRARPRFTVVRTRDAADTADFLVRAVEFFERHHRDDELNQGQGAEHEQEAEAEEVAAYAGAACRASAIRAKKRDNVDARQCYLQQLCQVPGVSHAIAVAIAGTPGFGGGMTELVLTLEALPDDRARLASLQRAPKVGKGIAGRILASIRGI